MKLSATELQKNSIAPSLSDVYRKLINLQDEFAGLLKRSVARNAKECDRLAETIRQHLHRAKVFLLSTNVNDALQEMDTVRNHLDQLHNFVSVQRTK